MFSNPPNHYTTKQVFTRFNTAMFIVFSLVLFIALTVAGTIYYNRLSEFEHQSIERLSLQASNLSKQLSQTAKTLRGIQEFANFAINNQHQIKLPEVPLSQEGDLFYLDIPERDIIVQRKQISANITGFGDISTFNQDMREELSMALALTPSFVVAQHSNPSDIWFYYVSKQKFVSLYPWLGRQSWHYRNNMNSSKFMPFVEQNSKKGELYWTQAFEDSAGKGLLASVAAGVYRRLQFLGALVIDIDLSAIEKNLLPLVSENNGVVILDPQHNVLIDHSKNASVITMNTSLSSVLPVSLSAKDFDLLSDNFENQRVGDWLVSKKTLPENGWVVLQYQHYDDFINPLISDFFSLFIFLILGLIAFIAFIYWLTRSTFIKPATEFIQHIEYCAQGDPGKITPNKDWLYWFQIVEDIFSQNRSLMQQLKDKNSQLDKRVNEKTAELQQSITKHQRDYALLRSVMNAIPEYIIFSDPNGILIGCNSGVEHYLDATEEMLIGQDVSRFMPERVAKSLSVNTAKALKDKTGQAQLSVVWDHNRTFELYSRVFFNEQQKVMGTINILRDVTEQYATQAALESAKNQAESANKAKSQFLANMSHEIRTPINAIQGMMLLLEKTSLSPIQIQYLQNAEIASKSLMYLIDELLDLSRIESGKISLSKSDVILDNIVEKALKLNIAAATNKGLSLQIDVASDVPHQIQSDEIRLVQVLANLLNNAIKFTAEGSVTLTISRIAYDENAANSLVKFSVKDTGIGIEQSKQSKLFEAFTQADESMTRQYGGSGLGLSICKQIVNLLGGDISITSAPNEGSKFSFVLPFSHTKSWQEVVDSEIKYQKAKNIQVTAFDINIPEAVVEWLTMQHWQFNTIHSIAGCAELNAASSNILLISSDYIKAQLNQQNETLWNMLHDKFALVGLCQTMMTQVDEQIIACFEQHNINWILVEQPITRQLASIMLDKWLDFQQPDKLNTVKTLSEIDVADQDLSGKRILLVEDNLVNQLVAKELLKSMNADVIIAENGQIAIDTLTTEPVDCVLMDIQMPVMDGLTAASKLRQQEKFTHLPIIAMTAHAREYDQQQSLAVGMNGHISKPVNYDLLLSSILSAIASSPAEQD